jgi:hypothetical protein
MQFSSKANLTELYLDGTSSGVDFGITLTIDVFDGNMASGTSRSTIGITLIKGMEESGIPIIGTELKQSRKNIIKEMEPSINGASAAKHTNFTNNEDRKCQSCDP